MTKDPQARIHRQENWQDYYLFTLQSPAIARQAHPGQFIMVRINSLCPYPLLRRPFSIHHREAEKIQIFFEVTGEGTSLLSQKRKGEVLDILGPLGRGFTIGARFKRKKVALVGGGRGIAPLYFLAHTLRSQEARVSIFYGGKTNQDLPLKQKIEKNDFALLCATDDGSLGFKGLVSDLFLQELQKSRPHGIFACGPEPMMEKIARMAKVKDVPAEFSLESIMGCGIGACWGCVRRIKKNHNPSWLKACQDGPVFSRDEIIWHSQEND